ncbi:dihydroneopterin aldolase [Microbacterium sp. LRZ72]|uniref:dihydroneopterin aldolase n=1 Tax=Microbacterium sp. LRZ72 TaxID=2942481 RepID=UPI0029ABA042|nr:dihydroneopterin aldolase [Microbacterium sp. LRZ72]MDX2377834.1 dihydroneopterin aldolase [Microbacterium sp. LRZ72]
MTATDLITLTGVRAFGRHGVLAHEREDGQDFVIDLIVETDMGPAAASDDVSATVHYGELAEQVVALVGGEPVDLIETLAARIAEGALAHPRASAVTVTVHKPQAPIPVPFADVAVTIRRERRS